MLTRRANDWTHRFRPIATLAEVPIKNAGLPLIECKEILEQLIDYPAIAM
jgi:hypothetical protein